MYSYLFEPIHHSLTNMSEQPWCILSPKHLKELQIKETQHYQIVNHYLGSGLIRTNPNTEEKQIPIQIDIKIHYLGPDPGQDKG